MFRSLVALVLVCALHSGVWAAPQGKISPVKPGYEAIVLPEDVHTDVVGVRVPSDGHLGCFRDAMLRDLPFNVNETAKITIEWCRDACQSLGFRFAGVQFGRNCSCGNSFGRFGKAENCNMTCSGNKAQICGGFWANNVYAVPGYVEPMPEGPFKHYGCYRDHPFRDLPYYAYVEDATNTIERCRATCQSFGFRFAGVQFAHNCFCGNSFGKYGKAKNCKMTCLGNKAQICGGVWANNIYGVDGYVMPKPEGKLQYFGCFKDGRIPDMAFLAFSGRVNIEKCQLACRARDFRFAAVQLANRCICGNSFGKYGKADNCNMNCSGEGKQICGGDLANSVFSAAYVKPK